jgi:deoxyribose-phosphate aldolase
MGAVEKLARRLMTAVFMPVATDEQALAFLTRVTEYPPIAGVFVDQVRVGMAAEVLGPAGIEVGTASAYPVGNKPTEAKVAAIRYAIRAGAAEIDIGAHFVAMKSGDYRALQDDTATMLEAAGTQIRVVPILETAILTNEEKLRALEVFAACGVALRMLEAGASKLHTSRIFQLLDQAME